MERFLRVFRKKKSTTDCARIEKNLLMRPSFLSIVLLFVYLSREVYAFNLDPYSALILGPPTSSSSSSRPSFFGYSHGFYVQGNDSWLLVGAPRANASTGNSTEPGVIYRCRLSNDVPKQGSCEELPMSPEPPVPHGYKSLEYNQWLGVSIDTTATNDNGQFVSCAHRRAIYWNKTSELHMPGSCFSWNNLKNVTTSTIVSPEFRYDKDAVFTWNPVTSKSDRPIFSRKYSQWGISSQVSPEGHIIMGATGNFQWQGSVIIKFVDSSREKICIIENITMEDSYLGYSVTSLRRNSNESNTVHLIASGAPRYNETGAVYIISVNQLNGGSCRFDTRQQITSKQFGSYFGASILAEDVNNDGVEELFVGAPFQNISRGDEGVVHVYRLNSSGSYEASGELTGSPQTGARFGTAMSSIGDINSDGYRDVIVGSPYEDEDHGTIYLFLGNYSGISTVYSQQIRARIFFPSLRAFGHSFGRGRDIDGNKYPDVSVGAYRTDSAVVLRSRPVHNVTARIWFGSSVIAWKKPNCKEYQTFNMTLTISFFYSIPEKEMENIEAVFMLVNFKNQSAFLDDEQRIVFGTKAPIKFLQVPCLAKSGGKGCFSFMVAGRKSHFLRQFADYVYIEDMYSVRNITTYNEDASFFIENNSRNSTVLLKTSKSYFLNSDENGYLVKIKQENGEILPANVSFTFRSGKYLPCIQGLSYDLNIDNRGFLFNKMGHLSTTVTEKIDFTNENIGQPLNRSWTFSFSKFPKNIETPMNFGLNIRGLNDSKATNQPPDHIFFNQLSPVLNKLSPLGFRGEIDFFKECGEDNICIADLRLTITSTDRLSGSIVIGGRSPLLLRFIVENFGEPAYIVHLQARHPDIVQFRKVTVEDECNQVTSPTVNFVDNITSFQSEFNFELENHIHKNGSAAFKVSFDTSKIAEENDYPHDDLEFLARVGTNSSATTESNQLSSFKVPIRYISELNAIGSSKDSELYFDRQNTEQKILYFTHMYDIRNKGPGLMPSVVLYVLLPDEAKFNLLKIKSIKVTHTGLRNGQTFSSQANVTEVTEKQFTDDHTDNVSRASEAEPVGPSIIHQFLKVFQEDNKERILMDCETGPCSVFRYNIGSMNLEDSLDVLIEIDYSAANLSKIENLVNLTYTSSILLSPYNINEDKRSWRESKSQRTNGTAKTSTRFLLKPEPPSLPIWLIVVGIGIGLLHIVAFILLLRKFGFFQRRQHEELQALTKDQDQMSQTQYDNNDSGVEESREGTNEKINRGITNSLEHVEELSDSS